MVDDYSIVQFNISPIKHVARSRFATFVTQGRLATPFRAHVYRPVFTLVHSRLTIRWVAGSRAVITNSFFKVASSG
jgi:hypothetical protein